MIEFLLNNEFSNDFVYIVLNIVKLCKKEVL